MGTYSMTLQEVMEMYTFGQAIGHTDRIEKGRQMLFDFEYPIFDENYRKVFETHFIRNFYTREIGFETEGLFKFNLETWLAINMPYFNKLFQSELLQFDPLKNMETDETHNKKNDTSQHSSSVGNAKSTGNEDTTGSRTDSSFNRDLESNNPDSRLAITTDDGKGVIEYASEIKEHTENDSSNTTGNRNSTGTMDSTETVDNSIDSVEDYISHKVGKIGTQTYSQMVKEYREIFLRIEKQIFKEMNQLFMLVY